MERKLWEAIRILAFWQSERFSLQGELSEYSLFVTSGEYAIHNPFHPELDSAEVDPLQYYGDAFLQSPFVQETRKYVHLETAEEIADAVKSDILLKEQSRLVEKADFKIGSEVCTDLNLSLTKDQLFVLFDSLLVKEKSILDEIDKSREGLLKELWAQVSDVMKLELLVYYKEHLKEWNISLM